MKKIIITLFFVMTGIAVSHAETYIVDVRTASGTVKTERVVWDELKSIKQRPDGTYDIVGKNGVGIYGTTLESLVKTETITTK